VNLKDVVLVANKNHAQDVKKVYEKLKEKNREECNSHTKVLRPWGSFETLDEAAGFKVKRIVVKQGASLSLQMHRKRAEHWIVVKGNAFVTCEERQFELKCGESTFIPLGKKHRLENKGKELLEIIEVQTGGYLGEDDIVRFQDIYGR
jgi:mannose-6-phosphate isomerase-like protein (cupin superfamily)